MISSRNGLPASRSAPSTRRSSPAIRARSGSGVSRNSGRWSPRRCPGIPSRKGDRARSLFNETSAALIATFGVPGFFTPRVAAGAAVAAGQPAVAELLRHRAAEADAGAAGRFRPHQRLQDAAQHRRRRRGVGQFQVFRQFRDEETRQEDRPGAHHGVRRLAAGLSRRSKSKASISGTAASPPTRRSIMCWMRRPTAIS